MCIRDRLNTKSDYCECCGYDGEIQIKEDENGKLIWECPNCGNQDQDKLFVARRTCGYIGTQFWNQGRTQEIKAVSYTHLKKIRRNVIAEREECGEALDETIINKVTERRLREEVKSGIQTIQYQLITLMTCNGQAPFVTMFMYLDEVEEGDVYKRQHMHFRWRPGVA